MLTSQVNNTCAFHQEAGVWQTVLLYIDQGEERGEGVIGRIAK